jgi:hypothetical protein
LRPPSPIKALYGLSTDFFNSLGRSRKSACRILYGICS